MNIFEILTSVWEKCPVFRNVRIFELLLAFFAYTHLVTYTTIITGVPYFMRLFQEWLASGETPSFSWMKVTWPFPVFNFWMNEWMMHKLFLGRCSRLIDAPRVKFAFERIFTGGIFIVLSSLPFFAKFTFVCLQ